MEDINEEEFNEEEFNSKENQERIAQAMKENNIGTASSADGSKYFMFTTFNNMGVEDDRVLQMVNYREALKKVITVADNAFYELFLNASENVEDGYTMDNIFLPQTILPLNDVPRGLKPLILEQCDTSFEKDNTNTTSVILRYFEYIPEEGVYFPVQMDFSGEE